MTSLTATRPVASAELWASRALLLACALMLATRLPLLLGLDVSQWSDLQWYYERAGELLEHGTYSENGLPTAYWPVGYPGFLAGVMAVAGHNAFAGQAANLALSLACAVMLCIWSVRQFGDARVCSIATLLLAIYLNRTGFTVDRYSEPQIMTLLFGDRPAGSPERRMCAHGLGVRVGKQAFYLLTRALEGLALVKWSHWRDPKAYPVPLMLAFFSALCMVFSGQSRYHAPMMPFIMAYAAWVVVEWHDRRSRA